VSKTPKCSHITPILKSQYIDSKLNRGFNIRLSLLPLQSNKPTYLNSLLHIQRNRNTRSSEFVTLQRPSVCFSLKLTDRSFTHHAPAVYSGIVFPSSIVNQRLINPPSINGVRTLNQTGSTLALSSSQFHAKLITFLFNRSFPPWSVYALPLMSVLWFLDLAMFFISYTFSLLSFTVIPSNHFYAGV